jgi:hypothetical protein
VLHLLKVGTHHRGCGERDSLTAALQTTMDVNPRSRSRIAHRYRFTTVMLCCNCWHTAWYPRLRGHAPRVNHDLHCRCRPCHQPAACDSKAEMHSLPQRNVCMSGRQVFYGLSCSSTEGTPACDWALF